MRKTLTISLSDEDWTTVKGIAERLGATYSAVFHKLIEMGAGTISNADRVEKYKALLAPHAPRLERRATVFSKGL